MTDKDLQNLRELAQRVNDTVPAPEAAHLWLASVDELAVFTHRAVETMQSLVEQNRQLVGKAQNAEFFFATLQMKLGLHGEPTFDDFMTAIEGKLAFEKVAKENGDRMLANAERVRALQDAVGVSDGPTAQAMQERALARIKELVACAANGRPACIKSSRYECGCAKCSAVADGPPRVGDRVAILDGMYAGHQAEVQETTAGGALHVVCTFDNGVRRNFVTRSEKVRVVNRAEPRPGEVWRHCHHGPYTATDRTDQHGHRAMDADDGRSLCWHPSAADEWAYLRGPEPKLSDESTQALADAIGALPKPDELSPVPPFVTKFLEAYAQPKKAVDVTQGNQDAAYAGSVRGIAEVVAWLIQEVRSR
jgi:hypothetical protein